MLQRRIALALGGVTLGVLFLALAARDIDVAQLGAILAKVDAFFILLALASYWLGFAFRIVRWRALLNEIGPVARGPVSETLVVGYAVNNVLPARLGEVFRADYAKRRFGFSRTSVLGSIVVERASDLAMISLILVVALITLSVLAPAREMRTFTLIALNAVFVIGALLATILILRAQVFERLVSNPKIHRLLDDLRRGIASLNNRSRARVILLTLLIWVCEGLALTAIIKALGTSLAPAQVMLLMSVASLSTIVPTAPGYLGSYQLVFVLVLGVFGYADVLGIAASVVVQIVLFGSVTAIGIGLLLGRSMFSALWQPISTASDSERHLASER